MNKPQVSLVIPIRNEEASIERLIDSIERQTLPPDEVVFVDGGSTDRTVDIVERIAATNGRLKLIRTDGATPGRGRNIGIEAASFEFIALTDAGITLENDWLAMLVASLRPESSGTSPDPGGENERDADIVYGNVDPVIDNLFEKCAAIAFVAAKRPDAIRMEFIASCLLKKQVWQKVGGFPDLRAAEDLMFMEAVDAAGFRTAFALDALVHWQLQPDVASTFRKFALYSKHNVWAGRQWDWHYGIVKLYLLLAPFLVLAAVHSWWWLLGLPLWIAARTAKRILAHKFEFGIATLFNPLVFLGVAGLILLIDMATFVGWGQASVSKQRTEGSKQQQALGSEQKAEGSKQH